MMTACLALFSLDPSRRPNVGAGVAQILYQHEVDVPERVPAKLTGRERS
jgi:hypothetical protein